VIDWIGGVGSKIICTLDIWQLNKDLFPKCIIVCFPYVEAGLDELVTLYAPLLFAIQTQQSKTLPSIIIPL
jgi:hypothetical protein